MNTKVTKSRYIRYIIQSLGILLIVIGFFTDYPMANSILLGAVFIIGPVFCGWICPLGTLQDIFARLGDKLGIKKYIIPTKLRKVLAFSRYILLTITILITVDFIFSILSLDPRAGLTAFLGGNTLAITGWVVIFIFLGISMFFERPFCNYLCIEGAKFGLFSSVRPLTIIRNEESCVNCNMCTRACPMNIDVASHSQVRSLQCINCMECVAACPVKNTLKVGLIPVKKLLNKVIIIFAAIACLFVVYTGTNSSSLFSVFASGNATSGSTVITGEIAAGYGDAAGIADGVYEGAGTGFRGKMTVGVTVKSQQITAINVTEQNEDAKWFDRAYGTVASNIIRNQTADVDAVSGATYSSMGIKEGVSNALINAGSKNVKAIVNDLPEAGKGHHGRRH